MKECFRLAAPDSADYDKEIFFDGHMVPLTFREMYSGARPIYSFEFFPPKRDEDLEDTLALVSRMSELAPDFMTVTYGAGGGTRQRTGFITEYIAKTLGVPAVAHLTCVGHSAAEIDRVLDILVERGIRHVLALRGDPPAGQSDFQQHPEGFACARDLIRHIERRGDFSIAAAGYPEVHPEAASQAADIEYLKQKVDAGAELIVTQLFFESRMYFDFVERARSAGIETPIVPGVLPIGNVKQVRRFTTMCGASIPEPLASRLSELEDDPDGVRDFGVEYAAHLCTELLEGGAPGIHLYTLNKSAQVERVMAQLRGFDRN